MNGYSYYISEEYGHPLLKRITKCYNVNEIAKMAKHGAIYNTKQIQYKVLSTAASLQKAPTCKYNLTRDLHIGKKKEEISYKLSRMRCQYENVVLVS